MRWPLPSATFTPRKHWRCRGPGNEGTLGGGGHTGSSRADPWVLRRIAADLLAVSATGPAIQEDYSDPELSPSQWTLVIHPDGSGHFRSHDGSRQPAQKVIEAPNVDRDIQVSKDFAARVFETAESHKWFNEPCESHLKVAFQGWKTLTYTGP